MNHQGEAKPNEERLLQIIAERIGHSARSQLTVLHSIFDDRSLGSTLSGEEIADGEISLHQLDGLAAILSELGRKSRNQGEANFTETIGRVINLAAKEYIACQAIGGFVGSCDPTIERVLLNLVRFCAASKGVRGGGVILEIDQLNRTILVSREDHRAYQESAKSVLDYLESDQRVEALWLVAAHYASLAEGENKAIVVYNREYAGLSY